MEMLSYLKESLNKDLTFTPEMFTLNLIKFHILLLKDKETISKLTWISHLKRRFLDSNVEFPIWMAIQSTLKNLKIFRMEKCFKLITKVCRFEDKWIAMESYLRQSILAIKNSVAQSCKG